MVSPLEVHHFRDFNSLHCPTDLSALFERREEFFGLSNLLRNRSYPCPSFRNPEAFTQALAPAMSATAA
jgi:hypothetical protein